MGADLADGGCPPRGPAEYGSVSAAVIHHTVNANDYAPEEAASIVLGICRFHVYGNGWNDIGYNALVDRYGTLYEGRAGAETPGGGSPDRGLQHPDHFDRLARRPQPRDPHRGGAAVDHPPPRLEDGGEPRLSGHRSVQLTSAGGTESRYPSGTVVTVPRILGHTTLNNTACPGGAMIPLIGQIQAAVQKRIKRYAKCPKKGKEARRCKRTRAR